MKERLHRSPAIKLFAIAMLALMVTFNACKSKGVDQPVTPPTDTTVTIPTFQISSTNLISGQLVTVTYNPEGRPLASAKAIYIYAGYNDWTMNNTALMKQNTNGTWSITYMVPQASYNIAIDFNDGNSTWDNNSGANWNYTVTPGTAPTVGDAPALPANASEAGVMMQGFYWDCPSGWYTTMASKAAELRNMQDGQGIDRIWFPPPGKGLSAASSMGYDPYDYYDVGQYNQLGTTATHFGTQQDLKNAIAAFKAQGIVTMADIVLNHRSGGASETNANLGTTTYTDYSKVASGKCTWTYNEFHPSTSETFDEGVFGGMSDVCYETGNTAGHPYYDLIEWGKWLQDASNAGFDGGWRFDFVKGFHPSMVADFRKGTGNAFGVIECWDNMKNIESFVKFTGNSNAFDFPGYYTIKDVFNNNASIAGLVDATKVYAAKDPDHAVTFAANHDIDEITDNRRMLAYAFILTYQGYPCIFWKDYFDRGLADLGGKTGNGIKALVWARGALAGGHPVIENLKANSSLVLVYGTTNATATAPGYVIAINNSSSAQTSTVYTTNTKLQNNTLECKAFYSYNDNTKPADAFCASDGSVTITVPAYGYALYSVK